jgi:hypothetical protein
MISAIKPERCLINEASKAEIDDRESFEKIILAAQQIDESKL